MAYLSSSISKGENLESSVRIANFAAGVAVGKFGTAAVNLDEIKNLKNIKLISYENIDKILLSYDKKKSDRIYKRLF